MNQPTPTETLDYCNKSQHYFKDINKQQTLRKAKSSQRVYVLLLPLAISLMGDDRGLLPRNLLAVLDVDSMSWLSAQPSSLQVEHFVACLLTAGMNRFYSCRQSVNGEECCG